MTSRGLDSQAFFSFIFLAFLYASFAIPVRFLAESFTILQQMYLWLLTGAAISFVVFRKTIRPKVIQKISMTDIFLLFLRATLFYTIGTTLWVFSIMAAKYSNIAFISAIPIGAIMGIIFFREKLTLLKALAIGGAMIGLLLVALKTTPQSIGWGLGEISAVLSLIFYPFSYVVRKLQKDPLNDAEVTTVILGIAGFSALLLSVLLGEQLDIVRFNGLTLFILLIAGLMNVGMQYFLNAGFRHSEMVNANIILNLDTVFGLLISVFFFREIPSVQEAIGGFIIFISAVFIKQITTPKIFL